MNSQSADAVHDVKLTHSGIMYACKRIEVARPY